MNVLNRLFKWKREEVETSERVEVPKFKAWELWQEKWGQKKIDSIWGDKVKTCVWRRDPAYKLIADYCAKYGHTVLDMGCGGGIQYAAIREFSPKLDYTGVDVTPKMLNAARKLFPGVKFEEGNAAHLQYTDGQFDLTVLRHVLEHHPISSGEKILGEALRVSKNATLILFFIEPKDMEEDIIAKQKKSGFYLNTYSRRWLEKKIGAATGEEYSLSTIRIPKGENSPALYDQVLYVIEKG